MKTVLVLPGDKRQRKLLEEHLFEWVETVLEAYDRGERINIHSHQEVKYLGDPDLLNEFIYQGWSFGASIGDYPKDALNHKRKKGNSNAKQLVGSPGVSG